MSRVQRNGQVGTGRFVERWHARRGAASHSRHPRRYRRQRARSASSLPRRSGSTGAASGARWHLVSHPPPRGWPSRSRRALSGWPSPSRWRRRPRASRSRSRPGSSPVSGYRAGDLRKPSRSERSPWLPRSSCSACGGHGVRNDHACSRDRSARLPRHSRTPAGCDLARLRRPGRPGDHSRTATLVQPRLRAGACRLCARGRLAGHARAGRVADGICSLLHAPLCGYGGAARVGVRLRARHLAPALPRRRDPLLRPGCACRLGAPTEEAQCRRTSCCPT